MSEQQEPLAENVASMIHAPIPPSRYRHPKENFYFTIAAVTGGAIWALILLAVYYRPIVLPYFVFLGIALFIVLRMMKASLFGNCLNINERQCPEIYAEVTAIARNFGLKHVPYVFVANSDGAINALAVRLVGKGYVILYGGLVDHYLNGGHTKELQFIVGHELAHHAAGHTALWKTLLSIPASWVPFLGKAYSRACEFTCDRAGSLVINDVAAAENALMSFAHGSESLKTTLTVDAFLEQEEHIPPFFAFLLEIGYSHPRLTRRVRGVREFFARG